MIKNGTIGIRSKIRFHLGLAMQKCVLGHMLKVQSVQGLYCPLTESLDTTECIQSKSPGRGFNPRRGRQHSFVENDLEIFSMVILSLPQIQEGQLSVSGERMCTILVNHLED